MNVLQTDRLILREYTIHDLPLLHAILSDPDAMRFCANPFELENTQSWMEKAIKSYQERGHGRWAIVLKENREFIGDAGIMLGTVDDKKEYDLGYIISPTHWGKGYATEAAGACKRFAFDKLKLKRLCAFMPVDHIASIRVAEKIGMRKEKEFHNKRNRNVLTYLYSLSNPEPG